MTPDLGQRWCESFTAPSSDDFAQITAPGITLDGSILARPVHGRHAVWATLTTADGIYDSLVFTHHAAADGRVYLEWQATALGMRIDGVTILVADDQGQFARVAVHHRPLDAVLAFSAEMARRLAESPVADRFYQSPLATACGSQRLLATGVPAWEAISSRAVVGTADRATPPALPPDMARTAHAHINEVRAPHPSIISDPAS
jgi:hypothetical protein